MNTLCPCRRKCSRHGDCAACRAYHADKKIPPACEKPPRPKRTNPATKKMKSAVKKTRLNFMPHKSHKQKLKYLIPYEYNA